MAVQGNFTFSDNFLLPVGRAHWVDLDKPAKPLTEGQPLKYRLTLVLNDMPETQELLKKVNDYKQKYFGNKEVKMPIVKADAEMIEKNSWYAGKYRVRMSASIDRKPVLYMPDKSAAVEGTIYPGSWVAPTVCMVGFKQAGNQGVMFIMKSVMFIRDGERIATNRDDGSQYDGLTQADIERMIGSEDKPAADITY